MIRTGGGKKKKKKKKKKDSSTKEGLGRCGCQRRAEGIVCRRRLAAGDVGAWAKNEGKWKTEEDIKRFSLVVLLMRRREVSRRNGPKSFYPRSSAFRMFRALSSR